MSDVPSFDAHGIPSLVTLSLSSSSTETKPSTPLDKENQSDTGRSALTNRQQESSESSATLPRKNHSSRRGNVTFHSAALPPLDRSHQKLTNPGAQHEFGFDMASPLRDRKMTDDTTAAETAPTANHSFSSASDQSLNTTSSSLEEHLIELMSSSMNGRQQNEAEVRSDCTNPVAWTLLRSGDEDSPFIIKENWSYLEEKDSNSRGATLSGKRPSSSPCLVRALPPSNAKRPRAQRASLATFSARSPSNLAFRPSFSPGY